jgi:transposase-like protein
VQDEGGEFSYRESRCSDTVAADATVPFGQVINVFVSPRRDATAARRFFQRAIGETKTMPVEVTTDQALVYPAVVEKLLPAAWHRTDR